MSMHGLVANTKQFVESLNKRRLTVPDVLPLAQAYYKIHPAGGSLHIVLDDGNIDDDSVAFCIKVAIEKDDRPGLILAALLYSMSKTQRKKIGAQAYTGGNTHGT